MDGSVKFKLNDGKESEFYETNLIDKIRMNKNGAIETFKYKKVKEDAAAWMKVIIEGKVSLYTNDVAGYNFYTMGGNGMGGFGTMSYGGGSSIIYYYVNHEGENEVLKITSFGNFSKNFKNAASDFFKACPVLVEKIQNKTYTKGDLEEVVEFYNSKCNITEIKPSQSIQN